MTKRKTKQVLDVLPDRYTARTDAIQVPLQTQIAQIQRDASEKQNQLDYYLGGRSYIIKPDQYGNFTLYMYNGEKEVPVPQEFIPRLRQSNRYIDMAFTPSPEQPTISPLSDQLIREQQYSPTYQNYLRRQRQNVYEHNQAKQQAETALNTVMDYAFNPGRWYDVGSRLFGNDGLSEDEIATIGLASMFIPVNINGKLKAVPEIIRRARSLIPGTKLNIEASSLAKINAALVALEKNPLDQNAIRTLKTQFRANPKLVEELNHFNVFDGMQEFNQTLAPIKIDGDFPNIISSERFVGPKKSIAFRHDQGVVATNKPVYSLSPQKASEYDTKLLNNVSSSESIITTAHTPISRNQVKFENGKYLRSNGDGTFTELKEGDWFLDTNNQMKRVISRDGKLTDLLDSEFESQRRAQIAKETESKIKEAEQRGRDSLQKELDEAKSMEDTLESSSTPEPEVVYDEPTKYAYLPLKNGNTIQLEVKGNTAVDPITGSTFELYPGTTRIKQMDYTPNPSFYQEYGKDIYDVDTGNPAKWKPRSAAHPLTWIQALYSKAGNPENPQRLVSNYGVWDFANKNKRFMNNTREFSPKRAWTTGLVLGATGAGITSQKGLWGVGKTVGNGAVDAGSYVLFGNNNPFETKQDSTTKQNTSKVQKQSDSQPVDAANAWGVGDMDAQLDSLRQIYNQ